MPICSKNAFSVEKFKGDNKKPLYKYTCYIDYNKIGYKDINGNWTSNPEKMREAINNPELQKDLEKKGTFFRTSIIEDIQRYIREMDIDEFFGDAYYYEKTLYLVKSSFSLSGAPYVSALPFMDKKAIDGIKYVIKHDFLF